MAYCSECGTENPERCNNGHCMTCVAEKFAYTGQKDGRCSCCSGCLECYGDSGGGVCNGCDSSSEEQKTKSILGVRLAKRESAPFFIFPIRSQTLNPLNPPFEGGQD